MSIHAAAMAEAPGPKLPLLRLGGVLRVTFGLFQGLSGYVRPAIFARTVLARTVLGGEAFTPGMRRSRNG